MRYDTKLIGERIKESCERYKHTEGLKLTQQELADKLNCTRCTVATWESGATIPSLDMLLKMCKLFDCSIGYLLGEQIAEIGDR